MPHRFYSQPLLECDQEGTICWDVTRRGHQSPSRLLIHRERLTCLGWWRSGRCSRGWGCCRCGGLYKELLRYL